MSGRRDLFELLCRLARPATDDLRDDALKLADFDAVKVGPEVDWSADPFGHPHCGIGFICSTSSGLLSKRGDFTTPRE